MLHLADTVLTAYIFMPHKLDKKSMWKLNDFNKVAGIN